MTHDPGLAIPILPSRDLHETRAFYERLGFSTTGFWPEGFGGYAILVRGDLVMHFFRYADLAPGENYGQCYWRVADPDGLYAEIGAADVGAWPNARLDRLENKPWGTREFAMVDPSGNLIRIGRPRAS